MLRLCLLLGIVTIAACLTGCRCDSQPEPLDAEQQRQFEEQLEEVQNQERMHFQQQE